MEPKATTPAEEILAKEKLSEYLLVTDETNKIVTSTYDYKEVVRLARTIRGAGGKVSVFKKLES